MFRPHPIPRPLLENGQRAFRYESDEGSSGKRNPVLILIRLVNCIVREAQRAELFFGAGDCLLSIGRDPKCRPKLHSLYLDQLVGALGCLAETRFGSANYSRGNRLLCCLAASLCLL
jgi:hypothetical protein